MSDRSHLRPYRSAPMAPLRVLPTARRRPPPLDRLAREGVRFADASSAVPLTLPRTPTILSGLLPPHHGLRDNGPAASPPGRRHPRHAAAGPATTGAFVGAFVLDTAWARPRLRGPTTTRSIAAPRTAHLESERRATGDGRALPAERDDPRAVLPLDPLTTRTPVRPSRAWRGQHPGQPYDVRCLPRPRSAACWRARGSGAGARTWSPSPPITARPWASTAADARPLPLSSRLCGCRCCCERPGALAAAGDRTPVSLADLHPRWPACWPQPQGPARRRSTARPGPALLAGREPAAGSSTPRPTTPASSLRGLAALTRPASNIAAPRPELYDCRDPARAPTLAPVSGGWIC